MWSRVICLGADDLKNLRTFELAPDLLLGNAMKATVSRGKQTKKYKFLFWPDHYVKEGHSMKLKDNMLTDAQLLKYAKRITKFRSHQRELAIKKVKTGAPEDAADGYLASCEKLAMKMHRGYFQKPKVANI